MTIPGANLALMLQMVKPIVLGKQTATTCTSKAISCVRRLCDAHKRRRRCGRRQRFCNGARGRHPPSWGNGTCPCCFCATATRDDAAASGAGRSEATTCEVVARFDQPIFFCRAIACACRRSCACRGRGGARATRRNPTLVYSQWLYFKNFTVG